MAIPSYAIDNGLVCLLYAQFDIDEYILYMSTKKWSDMICEECLIDCKEKDFLMGNKCCYRCVYNKKKGKEKRKKTPISYCRICHKEIINSEDDKNPRKVFCSDDCYVIGQKEMCTQHWTRTFRKEFPLCRM